MDEHQLVTKWRQCPTDASPYLFPGDDFLMEGPTKDRFVSLYDSFDEFADSEDFGLRRNPRLHLGLLPIPYIGHLRKAIIFVLMLNPGLAPGDYFAEQSVEKYRGALIRSLRQENSDDEYPFFFLDPQFAWHPGFEYWEGKFHSITRALATREGTTYQTALSFLAKNLACLELMPYHSKSFRAHSLLGRLHSTRAMIDYVQTVLVPRAQSGKALIVVARDASFWELPEHDNIVVYEGYEARSAHLTFNSRGGRAIARRFGLEVKDKNAA